MEDERSPERALEATETREAKYTALVSELQSIATERAFRIELEKVEAKYDMGEAIIRSGLYEPYAYGQQLIPMIAKDLGIGERTIYWVLQFYRQVTEAGGLQEFLGDVPKHQIRWSHVRKMLSTPREGGELPEPDEPADPPAKPFSSAAKEAIGYSQAKIGERWTEDDHNQLEWWLGAHKNLKGRRPHRRVEQGE
jgi:hypothetical protein|tara:strand:+ start:2283 stop:2867 length:585 start_codon:yes stop_codon:yes gene_type:complete